MTPQQRLKHKLECSIAAKQKMLENQQELEHFAQAVEMLVTAYRKGGRVYIAGNGGSAADAQHLATEFISKLAKHRPPIAAESLSTDTSMLTALGNDYGFETIFARQIEAKMKSEDIFLAITTSGMSENINAALRQCRKMGIPSILLAGRDGGIAKNLADCTILATGDDTNTIQEVHIAIYHALCECVEAALFPEI